jgi:hypothetical protein
MKRRFESTIILAIVCIMLAAIFAPRLSWSQLTTATISGTVTDTAGAVIPDAQVTIVNQDTTAQNSTKTNSVGSFVLAGLPVATYSVTVGKQGFATYTENDIRLQPTQVYTVSPALSVGTVANRVEVSARGVQVQTSTSEISTSVSQQEVETLPLNGRNFQSLSALMPGVTNTAPDTAQVQGGFLQVNTMSVGGLATTGTMYYVDGIWNMNTGDMLQLTITPNPDTIEEVRVLQNNYSAQYSLFGGNVVLLQTRSGTDTFHGNAFEYFRNDALDARNYFSPAVPALKQNIFGYTIGGPIYIPGHYNKDKTKTFFFWSQQWAKQHIGLAATGGGQSVPTSGGASSNSLFGSSPTAAMRQGTFNMPITDPVTGAPFPGNQIPTNRINQNALIFLNAFALLPNFPQNGFLNYINLNPEINSTRDDEIKVDQKITDKVRLMGEYLDDAQTNDNPNNTWLGSPWPTNTSPITTSNSLAQAQLTWIVTPSMVNSVSVNINRYIVNLNTAGIVYQKDLPNFQYQLPYNGYLSDRLPQVQFAGGWSPIGQTADTPSPHSSNLNDTISDDWSWVRGSHNVRAGFALSFGTSRENTFSASNGEWFFSGQFTGNPIADYLLGDAATFSQASTVLRAYNHYKIFSPYLEDQWKVSRRLTVTAGLRYEFLTAPSVQQGFATNFVPSLFDPTKAPIVNPDGTITPTPNYNPLNGLVTNGQNGVPKNFTTSHQNNWGPTGGFAYDLYGNGTTSIRGGFGITFTSVPTSTDCSLNCVGNPPIISTLNLVTPPFPSPIGAAVAPPAASSLVAQNPQFYPTTQVNSYSLSTEHQFPAGWFLSVAGAGNFTRHMQGALNINQPLRDGPYDFNPIINAGTVFPYLYSPYQGYASISQSANPLVEKWNALEVLVRHPMGHDFLVTSAYTWQHCLSDGRGVNFTVGIGVQDSYNPHGSYGTCITNSFNVWTSSLIWNLPWFNSSNGLERTFLGGWQFSDITTIQSGFAIDPGLATSNPGLATRPDRVFGTPLKGPRNVNEWFNTNAFSNPAPGYFGNAAVGTIIGPGVINFDTALYKDFHIKREATIQFRAEAFNVANHTNLHGVSTAYGSGNFGAVTSALDPRIFEFALRLHF